jgi:two-component sensor histidine kinase
LNSLLLNKFVFDTRMKCKLVAMLRHLTILAFCLAAVAPLQAKLVAHYDFSDGELLDNEVGAEYTLRQANSSPLAMGRVTLNRVAETAVFVGGVGQVCWLEADGPGALDAFTVSFWFRTDQLNQGHRFAGVFASDTAQSPESWQLHYDLFETDGLKLFGDFGLLPISGFPLAADQWVHVVVQKKEGGLQVSQTLENGRVGNPVVVAEEAVVSLNKLVFGINRRGVNACRMEMAHIKIYDSADVSVQTLFDEGSGSADLENISLFSIPGVLEKLTADSKSLGVELARLPDFDDTLQLDAYGYHSTYLPAVESLPEKPRWTVELMSTLPSNFDQLYLLPAADRRFNPMPGYGFPKRFRIIGIDFDGEETVLADWRYADYPDPGRLPARFPGSGLSLSRLVLEVYRGQTEGGKEFFALDEVLVKADYFVNKLKGIQTSSSFESLPFWSEAFLYDQKTSFGLPVLPGTNAPMGFIARFDQAPEQPCVIELDLGTNEVVNMIVLYPAQPPEGIVVPGFGFPGSVQVELFGEELGGRKLREVFGDAQLANPGNNVVRFVGKSTRARWVRLTFDQFPEHEGMPTFALGEIEISGRDKSLSADALIRAEMPPGASHNELERLTDSLSGGKPVISMMQWLDGLDFRKELGGRLERNGQLNARLEGRWIGFVRNAVVAGVSVLILALAGAGAGSVVWRRRQTNRFRQRVTQDLHDDIGSKVGAISLATTYLQKTTSDPGAKESARDIEEIAQDMKKALRDVLWFTNSQSDTLREMVCKLKEIAESMIPSDLLVLSVTPLREIPASPIRVKTKRDLLMFFKEVLHNVMKHAEATRVDVTLHWDRTQLLVRIVDNGKGFSESADHSNGQTHLGMDGLRRRAGRLHGELRIESGEGGGTVVELIIKSRKL